MVTTNAQTRIRREIAGMLLFVAIGMVVEVFVTGLPRLNPRVQTSARVARNTS